MDHNDIDSEAHDRDLETYELTVRGELFNLRSSKYLDNEEGSSIDWLHEEAMERERTHRLRSQPGVRGLILPLIDVSKMWLVVVLTGIGIGVAGAWLDILVKWLSNLREGLCSHGFLFNQTACCRGVDPGEICREWQTWSQWFNVRTILGQSLLQIVVYVSLAVSFAGTAAILVQSYAPYAFHTGIPEIKAILGGYVLDEFLSPGTLLIKALGLALAVASGLSLGKEGPLVHVSCCLAYLLSRAFTQFRNNEAQKRKLLAAAAAAGVSVAFGSPLGGVLFGLEELDAFANESDVMWRGFVASAIAAVSLQWIDPFGTAKLVLFQVTSDTDTWRSFELVPWLLLGVIGGVLGSILIKLNVAAATYRHTSSLKEWPVLEVLGVSAITAAMSYLVVFSRVQTSELVANLFQECDPNKGDYHGLCNFTAMWENVFLLTITALLKLLLTAWTFGMMVPAGIFLPTIGIGACLGRAMGLLTQGLQRAYPRAWIFLSCPPDPSEKCVSTGFYAVIGAAAMLGGVTRMTISLVVILFELTGALSHVLPIMICVMTSKWVGDAIGTNGIYSVWIAMRKYPWLPRIDYHDKGETGADIMRHFEELIVVDNTSCTVLDLDELVRNHDFHGFPVVHGRKLVGLVTHAKLKMAIDAHYSDDLETMRARRCTFYPQSSRQSSSGIIDMSQYLETTILHLRKDVPLETTVAMFQQLNLRQILFTEGGKLTGMVCKRDVVALLTEDFAHAGALSR